MLKEDLRRRGVERLKKSIIHCVFSTPQIFTQHEMLNSYLFFILLYILEKRAEKREQRQNFKIVKH
jgi:hypothetical protein